MDRVTFQPGYRPVIVAPVHNDAPALLPALEAALSIGLPILLIDDASTDTSPAALRAFAAGRPDQVALLTHRKRRGRAAALRTGFTAAFERGFSHALSLDTPAHCHAADLLLLLQESRPEPFALVVGVRDFSGHHGRRPLAQRLSNHLVRLASGVRISDTQCGRRVYPLGFVSSIKCRAQHRDYETEIIARAGWAGCPIIEVPVPTPITHQPRTPAEALRTVLMHGRLVLRALCPWTHKQWPGALRATPESESLLKETLHWMSPRHAWPQLRYDHTSRSMFATGLAAGVFVANLPLYGAQTALCLYLARRLHLHPVSVIAGCQISTPPVCFALIAAAVYLGHLMLFGSPPTLGAPWSISALVHAAPHLALAWTAGSIVVGALLAAATFFAALWSFRLLPIGQSQPTTPAPSLPEPQKR
jgi:uncharacterized protein (DUF2062 family)